MLSIALPIHNGADYLEAALESILSQKFREFELVVSDNASTDRTPEILRSFAARDIRLRLTRSDRLLPQQANVNRAVELCTSEWVKLFCHDDLMQPTCLERVEEAIRTGGPDLALVGNGEAWLFTNGYIDEQQAGPERIRFFNGQQFVRDLLSGHSSVGLPSLTTATVRKTAWSGAGRFDERFFNFDVFLWHRVLMRGDFAYIPDVLTINRIHGRQVAVTARRSGVMAKQHRLFYRELMRDFADELKPSFSLRIRTALRSLGQPASAAALCTLRGDRRGALKALLSAPPWSWPVMPFLHRRSLRRETQKVERLKAHVPLEAIYP